MLSERPAVTGYGVRYCKGETADCAADSDFTAHTHTGVGRTATLTGLDADTRYQVQVRAANDDGNSAWSASEEGRTPAFPTLSIADATVDEDAGTATLTVTLAPAAGALVRVDYATADGTAIAGDDYTAKSGTLRFTAGQTSKTVTVSVLNDTVLEGSEYFEVTLSHPSSNVVLGTAMARVVIRDDEDLSLTLAAVPGGGRPVTEGERIGWRTVMSRPPQGELGVFLGGRLRRNRTHGGVQRARRQVVSEPAWTEAGIRTDDDVIEAHGSLTVTLLPGEGYAVGEPSRLTVRVLDNDGGSRPGAPSVTQVSSTMLDVGWVAPAANGAPLTGYDVEHRAQGANAWRNGPSGIGGDAVGVRLARLAKGTAHEVRVRARNARGAGAWSAPGHGTTAPDPGVRVSIAAAVNAVVEGKDVGFELRVRPVQGAPLPVRLGVSETVDALAPGARRLVGSVPIQC